ncbi:MAG: hypothetical protein Q8O66_03310 [bacterium]|nr:hypothetical protein [bacterium]
MFKKIIDNKYSNAFLLLLLYSAIFHFIVLIARCFLEKSIYPLNFFTILNLDILFPYLFKNTPTYDFISLVVVLIVYVILIRKQKFFIEKKDNEK